MIRKIYGALLLTVLWCLHINGQVNVSGLDVDLQEKTPQSPNAGQLGKYFDLPVNMATGIPKITIPLYEIKTGNITIPVFLSYHAGGVQVNDIAGWVGTNWSLIAGGSVVKKTNGLDDFFGTTGANNFGVYQTYMNPNYSVIPYDLGYNNMTDVVNSFNSYYTIGGQDSLNKFLASVVKGSLDGEADEFNYTTPSGGGKFCYNQKLGAFQTRNIDGSLVAGDQSGWTITNKNGLVYYFGVAEKTENQSYLKGRSSQQYSYTAWHLNTITDPVTGKQVALNYTNYYKANVPEGLSQTKDYDNTSGPIQYFASNSDNSVRNGDNQVLESIYFNTGTIYFIKDSEARSDYGPNTLKEIRIANNNGLLLKKFSFTYYYDNNRLFLKSVSESDYDRGGNIFNHPAYQFAYDTAYHLPARLSYAQDKWGYYNGKSSNTTSIPSHPLAGSYPILQAANRNVDSNYARAGILKKIIYPTGGQTRFDFESNKIGIDSLVGGLRIKRITHIDSAGMKNLTTEYSYNYPGQQTSSANIIKVPVYNYDLYHVSGDVYSGYNYRFLYRMESSPINELFPNQGSPVFYSFVEKRDKGNSGDLMSRHYFSNIQEAGEIFENMFGVPHAKELGILDMPELYSENYAFDPATNNYSLVSKDSSGYSMLVNQQNAIWNLQGAWTFLGDRFAEWPGGDPTILYPMNAFFPPSFHAYKTMPCSLVSMNQFKSSFSNGTRATVPSYYTYDSTNGNVKSVSSVNSKGDTTIKIIKYSCDYGLYSSPAANNEIRNLNDYNMKASPVEVITLIKEKNAVTPILAGAVFYEYENLKVKRIYKVYDKMLFNLFTVSSNNSGGVYKDSHYKLEQEVTSWDNEGRPLTVILNNNSTSSYVWDAAFDQPLAVVTNAATTEVAYTSFEGSGSGNWTLGSATRNNAYYLTGKSSYLLSNGTISKTGLSGSKTYILSYWSKNGTGASYNISGTTSVKEGKTVRGWTYYEHTISGVTAITISGTSYIDELRLYPQNAQMVSFCYETLLGMTSQDDAKSQLTFFEYSGPDKLSLIRDIDNNVLKKICYNFAGQIENCTTACQDTTANWVNTTTPIRCQVNANGENTGYQVQEQRDMNSCSGTYNQLRWNPTGINTTACPVPVYVNLTSTNSYSTAGYQASYYNTTSGATYTFNVSTGSGLQPLGTVPEGTYNLTISRPGYPSVNTIFKSGCNKFTVSGTSASFKNVTVSSAICNSITVTLDITAQ